MHHSLSHFPLFFSADVPKLSPTKVGCNNFPDLSELDSRRHRVPSLQNRPILFCVFLGQQGRKQSEREARVAGRYSPRATHGSRSPRFRLCSPKICTELHLFCRLQATYLSFLRF